MAAIDPKTCAVLALSMTPESMAGYPNAAEMLQKTARIMAAARRASIPVIHGVVGFREGYPEVGQESMFQALKRAGRSREGSAGIAPHPDLHPAPTDILLRKRRAGAFQGTDLDLLLRAQGRRTLALMGVRTSGAILFTSCWATDLDYRLAIITDCCADPNEEVHRVLLDQVLAPYGTMTAEEFLAALATG